MMEQSSITTRAKAQKLNNLNENITKSRNENKRSVRGKKSVNTKDDLEATVGQNVRKKSLNAKVTDDKSKKKKTSSRRLNIVKEAKSRDKTGMHKDESTSSNELEALSNKHVDNNLSQWTNSADLSKTPKKNNKQQKVIVPGTKEQSGMITPKSTPIKLSLTPHRSTKTPKKSPISLSSPKTHSVSVSRLLKTPRKLSLTPGENLYKYNNDSDNKKLRKVKKDSPGDVPVSNESSPALSVMKSKRISNVKLRGIAHRFSKSPRIVLRSPSKKSPKLNISARRKSLSKKSLANTVADTLSNLSSTESSSARNTPSPNSKTLSADKHRLLNSKLAKLLTASQMRDVLAEPIVLLKKLSLKSTLLTAAGGNQLNHSINAKLDTIHLRESSRQSSAAKTTNRSAGKLSPTRGENKTSTPLMSSTPREETPITRVNPTPGISIGMSMVQDDTAHPNTRSRYTNQSSMQATPSLSPMNKSATIEDVSKPSLLDIDIGDISLQAHLPNTAKQDTTYDVDQAIELKKEGQNNMKDVTYELKDPQTPGLRQMIRKRTATDANLSARENAKKSCRVRFANVKPDENGTHNSVGKSIGNRQSSATRNSDIQRNITIMNSAHKSRRVEILKFGQDSLASPLNVKSSPKMSRVIPRGRRNSLNAATLEKIQATPKRLESAEKKSEKKSSVKKVPNFKRIHEKMFAKSESVVDARKRLEGRHLEFATKKVVAEVDMKKGMKLLPSDTTNGTYNRFGFKLRKAEATHVILKKQTVFSRQKQQHETRTVLKSVRTNRRFELQMKARNINTI